MKKILVAIVILMSQSASAVHDSMQEIYNHLIELHKNDKAYVAKAINARKKWEDYKKAQADFVYSLHGGTLTGMCELSYKGVMDEALSTVTRDLFVFQEGDSCTGIEYAD